MKLHRNPLDAFWYARFDPLSLFFGAHNLLTGQYLLAVTQTTLSLSALILFAVLSSDVSAFNAVCCYPDQRASTSEFAAGGACDNPASLMYTAGGCPSVTTPLNIVLTAVFGTGCIVAAIIVYFATYNAYVARLNGHLKFYLRTGTALDLHHEIQEDEQAGPHNIYTASQMLLLFPVTSLLLSLHEKGIGNKGIYYVRMGLIIISIVFFFIAYCYLLLNRGWGCYGAFRKGPGPDLSVLKYGLCTDPTSDVFQWTGGMYEPWSIAWEFLGFFLITSIAWLLMYGVRWFGITLSGTVWVARYQDAFIEALQRFECEKNE